MDYFLPSPSSTDRCALCDLLILPGSYYVHTYDELGRAQWWHMTCRDRMLPFLLPEREEASGREEDDL
jgi:hypothetical protein